MTVQDLLDALNSVEDKTLTVRVAYDNDLTMNEEATSAVCINATTNSEIPEGLYILEPQ